MRKEYSFRSKFMHALIALLILGLLVVGIYLEDIPEAYQSSAYMLHKSFGLVVLFLMFLRITFIIRDGRPKLPSTVAKWERVLSRTVQYSLYLVLVLMPISGWIMSVASNYTPRLFNLFDVPLPFVPKDEAVATFFADSHYYLAWIIGGLLLLHILGNIKHYWFDKDGVVQTMWRFKK